MNRFVVPTSFTAGRIVTLLGTTYQPGATVPNAVVKQVRPLSALVSRRILVPDVAQDPGAPTAGIRRPRPELYNSRLRAKLP